MVLHYVEVRAGDCPCPGTPHEVEKVGLLPSVSMPMGVAALKTIQATPGNIPDMTAALTDVYFRYGIAEWSFVDATGTRIEISPETTAELLPWDRGGYELANEADTIYSEAVFRPLVKPTEPPSLNGRTAPSMSPNSGSGSKHRGRSKRSSPNGTAGKPSEAPVF